MSSACPRCAQGPVERGSPTQNVEADTTNSFKLLEEPDDHAVGRSRGGLSTKIHHACDGKGRPLAFIIGPGQGSDSRMFPQVMDAISAPRASGGRARTRPDAVLGDKAYASRANRKRRGSRGGRPVDFDTQVYKGRAAVEQSFNLFKQWPGIATRYDKLALTYRAGVALYMHALYGYVNKETRPSYQPMNNPG